VLAAMEDPRWTQLTNEIAAKDAEIKALSEQWRQCSDPALEVKLKEEISWLRQQHDRLLDDRSQLVKTLAAAAAAQPQQGVCGSGWLYALCTFVLLYLGESSMHARCKMQ